MKKKHGNTKHGHTNPPTRTYTAWIGARQRCENKNDPRFRWYGGRGIHVCRRWRSFANFLADMGPVPPRKELDRKNNDGHYCKRNCRWTTRKNQIRNSRVIRRITFHGVTLSIGQWEKKLRLSQGYLRRRLRFGWSLRRALSTPNIRK